MMNDLGLGMAKRKRGVFGWIWYVIWRLALLIVVLLLILRFLPPPTTAFMLQSPTPVTYEWVGIQHLPSHVSLAVVGSEDQRFPDHFGVDFTAISKAITQRDEGENLTRRQHHYPTNRQESVFMAQSKLCSQRPRSRDCIRIRSPLGEKTYS